MREKILAIINEMKFASADEINSILENVKAGSLKREIENLEQERILFRVLPHESSASLEGFVAGPNFEVEEDLEIRKLLVAKEFSGREFSCIDWKSLADRKIGELLGDIERLLNDIVKKSDESKKLELRYFELSLRYHELCRFLYEKRGTEILTVITEKLENCRQYLDKLEY